MLAREIERVLLDCAPLLYNLEWGSVRLGYALSYVPAYVCELQARVGDAAARDTTVTFETRTGGVHDEKERERDRERERNID